MKPVPRPLSNDRAGTVRYRKDAFPRSRFATANRAVFLDRDGTIIQEVGHLRRVEDMVVYPFSARALRRLRETGFLLVVITNQSAIGRGWASERALENVHTALNEILGRDGGSPDAYYYCPHHPDALLDRYRKDCDCRKPKPGLLHRAAADLGIELARSYFVGDTLSDVEAGGSAGCRTLLVRTGYGTQHAQLLEAGGQTGSCRLPDYIANDLLDASGWIISQEKTVGDRT